MSTSSPCNFYLGVHEINGAVNVLVKHAAIAKVAAVGVIVHRTSKGVRAQVLTDASAQPHKRHAGKNLEHILPDGRERERVALGTHRRALLERLGRHVVIKFWRAPAAAQKNDSGGENFFATFICFFELHSIAIRLVLSR